MAGVPVARDAGGVVHRLLVAFNHRARYTVFQFHQRFSRVVLIPAGTVEHQLLAGGETGAVALSQTTLRPARRFQPPASAADQYRARVLASPWP